MKKAISILLAMAMLLTVAFSMGMTAFAEDTAENTEQVTDVPFAEQLAYNVSALLMPDKAEYAADDAITVTLTVWNDNPVSLASVKLETEIPEGYVLSEGSVNTAALAVMDTGEEQELKVVYEKAPAETTTTTVAKDTPKNDSPKTADNSYAGIAVVMVLGGAALVTVLAIKGRKARQLLSLTLVCALALTGVATAMPAVQADAEEIAPLTLAVDVTVDGAPLTLKATVSFAFAGEPGDLDKVLDGAKLVAFGDSLTAFGTWPLSVAENCNMYLFNGAMGGTNTDEAMARFDKYVANRDADFVTLCYGMNDLLMESKNNPQVTPEKFKENMKAMCEKIVDLGATPILLTSSYLDESKFYTSQGQSKANYDDVGGPLAWLDVYNDKVRELAVEEGYHLVDIRAACDDYAPAELLADDGIHLGDLGNELYTTELSDYLLNTFTIDPEAERITTWFSYVASPAEPATLDIISYDPAMWDTPNAGEMTFASDANGALLIANTNGKWPEAHYAANESVLVPMNGTELVYDFSTANVNTSIILFFGGATPFATTEGKYVVINNKLGVNTEAGSGDVMANQTVKGSVKLTDLNIPATALDANGNLLISGVKVFAAGTAGQNVTIRQLAVSTTGAPVQ